MKKYTSDNPVFSKEIDIVERTDLVNYENKTKSEKQLLQNDLVLKKRMDKCLGEGLEYGDSKDQIVTFDSDDSENVDTGLL